MILKASLCLEVVGLLPTSHSCNCLLATTEKLLSNCTLNMLLMAAKALRVERVGSKPCMVGSA